MSGYYTYYYDISDSAKPGDMIGLGQHGRQRDWLSSACLWVMIGQEQPACYVMCGMIGWDQHDPDPVRQPSPEKPS